MESLNSESVHRKHYNLQWTQMGQQTKPTVYENVTVSYSLSRQLPWAAWHLSLLALRV